MNQIIHTLVTGHVKIQDRDTGEVLLDKDNAIHPENMGRCIARGLAREPNSYIYAVQIGNGGTKITGVAGQTGNIDFLEPNIIGTDATLYNATYSAIVDEMSTGAETNTVISGASASPLTTSTVTIQITLDASGPVGQADTDGVTIDPDSAFTFDELGLFTAPLENDEISAPSPANLTGGYMLSMLVFTPIEKTANRSLILTYTLTVQVS